MRTIVHSVRTLVLICFFLPLGYQSYSQSITTGNGKIELGLGIGPLFFLGGPRWQPWCRNKVCERCELPRDQDGQGYIREYLSC